MLENQTPAYKYRLLAILILYLLINLLTDFVYRELNMIICLVSSSILVYKSRKEVGSTLIFLFLLLSLIQISPEFLFGVRTTPRSYYYIFQDYSTVIAILMFFITAVAIFYKEREPKSTTIDFPGGNSVLFYALLKVLIFILIFGVHRGSYTHYFVSIKTIYEYFIMVFLFAYYYSSKTKYSNFALLVLAIIYVLQDLYYGGRISSVQFIILFTILFFPQIKFKYIMGFTGVGFILLNLVEVYRLEYSFSNLNLAHLIKTLFTTSAGEYKGNTFSEVLYSSSALVYCREMFFSTQQSLVSFSHFIINIFAGGIKPFGNIVAYISQYVSRVGGGGFLPAYFYFWLGWGGVFFITWLVIHLLNSPSHNRSSNYFNLGYILILAMFPRWYFYTPLILFRYNILVFSLMFYVLALADWKLSQKSAERITNES